MKINQNLSKRNGSVSVVILLLFTVILQGQVAQPRGELQLYTRATQIGTVASRTFKDAQGRSVKIIYYTAGGSLQGPYREELLREQSIHLYRYDEHNCAIKKERYEPGMRLSHVEEVRCFEGTATPQLSTVYDSGGIKLTETRYLTTGSKQTVFYFDKAGEKVVAINGEVSRDTDLAGGWGMEFGGFLCGIATNRATGRQEELEVYVSIKNISHKADSVVMISPVRVELKDGSGRVVKRKAAYQDQESKTQIDGCPTEMGQGAPSVGRSQPQPGYNLGEQYDRLTPGIYTLTIMYCVAGVPGRLVSNAIYFEIEGGKN